MTELEEECMPHELAEMSIEHAIKLGMLLAGAPEHELSRFGLGRLSLLHAAAEVRRRLYREVDDGE